MEEELKGVAVEEDESAAVFPFAWSSLGLPRLRKAEAREEEPSVVHEESPSSCSLACLARFLGGKACAFSECSVGGVVIV